MPSDRPNVPVPDELAKVKDEIEILEGRASALRELLIAHPDLRTGNEYIAEVKTVEIPTLDRKELRRAAPELVAEYTHALKSIRVEVLRLTEDGEIVRRKGRRT